MLVIKKKALKNPSKQRTREIEEFVKQGEAERKAARLKKLKEWEKKL